MFANKLPELVNLQSYDILGNAQELPATDGAPPVDAARAARGAAAAAAAAPESRHCTVLHPLTFCPPLPPSSCPDSPPTWVVRARVVGGAGVAQPSAEFEFQLRRKTVGARKGALMTHMIRRVAQQ